MFLNHICLMSEILTTKATVTKVSISTCLMIMVIHPSRLWIGNKEEKTGIIKGNCCL